MGKRILVIMFVGLVAILELVGLVMNLSLHIKGAKYQRRLKNL